tara:strand:+ start:3892 stop:5070 length:1179 start_codon:yes stop_codon:yes gene_type:complete
MSKLEPNIEAKRYVDNTVSRIVFSEPFFACILLKQERKQDESQPTAWVNGTQLGYNPEWVLTLSNDELKGLLLHETLHLVHMHHLRRGDRCPKSWNVAGDHVINLSLDEGGYYLPPDGLKDPKFKGMSTEEVYAALPPGGGGGGGSGPGTDGKGVGPPSWGDVRDQKSPSGNSMTSAETQEAIQELKVTINQAAEAAKRQGNLPAGISRLVDQYNDPKLPWREILSRTLGERVKTDMSWAVPNRRYLPQDIILPGPDGESFGKVVLANDTSASISSEELKEIAGECMGCISMYDEEGLDVTLTCLWCDTSVSRQDLKFGDEPNPVGGGGTSFTPVFDYIEKHKLNPQVVIYTTDGYCDDFPEEEPSYHVLWGIIGGNRNFKPPFGEVMHVNK